jgi:hypothetical protein
VSRFGARVRLFDDHSTCRHVKKTVLKSVRLPPLALTTLALLQYRFATPEIRLLMRHTLGYALSGRTIKRLAKSHGRRLKRGRPKTTPRVQKKQLNDLIETTSARLDVFNGNALHFLNHIELEFGLSPRQYLKWVTQYVRRGKCMMWKCLICGGFFASLDSSERHCQGCKTSRRRLLKAETRSIWQN